MKFGRTGWTQILDNLCIDHWVFVLIILSRHPEIRTRQSAVMHYRQLCFDQTWSSICPFFPKDEKHSSICLFFPKIKNISISKDTIPKWGMVINMTWVCPHCGARAITLWPVVYVLSTMPVHSKDNGMLGIDQDRKNTIADYIQSSCLAF